MLCKKVQFLTTVGVGDKQGLKTRLIKMCHL